MKKVLVYSPNPLDGVSYYRQWGPISLMHDKIEAKQFSNIAEEMTHWTWYLNYDCCLFSRPHKFNDFYFMEQCKKFGLPVWVDYDDALLHITPDNPVYKTFASLKSREYILSCLKMASVITVSSLTQKKEFEEKFGFRNVVFLPNALDDRFIRFEKPFNPKGSIAWRGSDSHLQDLFYYQNALINCVNYTAEENFAFFGIYPYFMESRFKYKNWKAATTQNLIDFVIEWTKENPKLVLVPLVDTFFNRVKSNLAWIDATLAGAAVLAPDIEAWDAPGITEYRISDNNDFFDAYKVLVSDISLLKSNHRISREWQKDNILLSNINKKRLEIIKNL